ncbi:hypothetical protein L9F63_019289, partial [Diploptera punctata]
TKKSVEGESKSSYFVINKSEQKNAVSEEPSLDDYENIPIEGFGLAMLRGMGWKAGGSTSNSGSVFSTEPPLVRPRGLGLGADRITSSLIQKSVTKTGETLELAKGAYIEGFMDDDEDEENTPGYIDPDDVHFLRSLDPKNGSWQDQDHYAVLGLRKLRHKATEDDIKKAYRLKVLRHHPDKRRARGEEVHPDDDYFTCITRAYDILGNPRNRRSYDSVDPQFDNSLPVINEHSRNNFYEVFGKAFDLNSRWSEKMPVPKLGNESTPRGNVEKFYSFWYDFQSWREYSYLDEEEKDQAQGREERKWAEKQNKATRAKRKKEEMARIRTLVDTAYNMDPRIQKFKQEDKDRKMAAKQAKKVAARARQEEEERKALAAEEEMRKLKEEAEAEQRAKLEAMKAERETQKRALKKERATLRKIAKENNYYAKDTSEVIDNMASLEKICECLRLDERIAFLDGTGAPGVQIVPFHCLTQYIQ